MAIPSLVLVVSLALSTFAPVCPVPEAAWRLRALTLLGAGICAACLLGWLFVTRDRKSG